MEIEPYMLYIETAKQQMITLAEPIILNTVFFLNRKWIHFIRFCEWLYHTHIIHYPIFEYIILSIYLIGLVIKICVTEIYNDLIYLDREPNYPFLARIWMDCRPNILSLNTSLQKYDVLIREISLEEESDIQNSDNIPNTFDEINKEVEEYYHQSRSESAALPYDEKINHEILLISKDFNNRYCSRVFTGEDLAKDEYEWKQPVESNIEFLSISYSTPDMKEDSISIELSPNYLFVGNQILSRTFIAKYLSQLPIYTKYIYNKNYTIDIMDSELNMIQLGWNDYIILKQSSYRVITRKLTDFPNHIEDTSSQSPSDIDDDDLPPPLIPFMDYSFNTASHDEVEDNKLYISSEPAAKLPEWTFITHTPNPLDETVN